MADKFCPKLSGPVWTPDGIKLHEQPCIEHRCRWYIQLLGKNPQTGEAVPEWGCAVEFLPVLLIENAHQTRQHAAAVESARNRAAEDAGAVAAAVVQVADSVRAAVARPVSAVELHDELRERHARSVAGPGLLRRLGLAFKGGQ